MRDGGDAPTDLKLGGITVDFAAGNLRRRDGTEIPLRAQSFSVLRHLADNAGRTMSKDELMAAVWGDIAVTDDSLVQCIRDIRRALGDEAQKVLRTVPRRGYRLETPEHGPAARRWSRASFTALAAALFIGVVAAASGLLFLDKPPPPPGMSVVAVLPLADLSADGSLGHMSKGIAEDIIAMLARTTDLAVVSGMASSPFRAGPVDLAAAGADYVLQGGIRRGASDLRITAQLVDLRTGRHLWAARFDESDADPLALQDRVAGKVVGALTGERGQIFRSEYRAAWGADTLRLGEYDYFLRGHEIFMRFEGRRSNDAAARIWRQGLAHYPDSALLQTMLGWYHFKANNYLWSDNPEADLDAAERFVREVLARDNLTPMVQRRARWLHAQLLVQRGDLDHALAEARIAVDMAPNDAFTLWALADSLIKGGETEQSAVWLEKAARLDPRQRALHHPTRADLFLQTGRYDAALAEFRLGEPLVPPMQLLRAITLVRLDRLAEAKAQVRAALDSEPHLTRAIWRRTSYTADPAVRAAEIADLASAGLPE